MRTKFNGLLTLLLALVVQLTFAQQKTISGNVTDQDGLPLPGVNILVKGTTTGTQTDFDGNYKIQASNGQVLLFSYVGQKSVARTVGASATINVQMEEDAEALDEVVVTGYSATKKATLSSAVATVKAEELENRPVASVAQALQARAPGLNIATGNGQPGANSVILLRGVNSINGNVEPLFIIDGLPVDEDDFRAINPIDIASATVLKDASATAIYGNRATGGVIVITTKKGKNNSKLEIKYSGKTGFTTNQSPNFTMANSKQLLTIERERGVGVGGGAFTGNAFVEQNTGLAPGSPLTDAQIDALSNTNTDWRKILNRTGITTSHDLSFSSGSDKMAAYTSVGYFEQQGIALRSSLQRMTFRNNLTYRTDKFSFNSNLTVAFTRSDFAGGIGEGNASGSLSNPFIVPYVGKPYLNPYKADGTLDIWGNTTFSQAAGFLNTPFIALNVANFDQSKESTVRILGSSTLGYDFTSNLKSSITVGVDFNEEVGGALLPSNSIRGARANDENAQFQGFQSNYLNRDARINTSGKLQYSNSFNDVHNLTASAFFEFIYAEASGHSLSQTGLVPGLEGVGAGFIAGNTTEDPDGNGVLDYYYIPGVGQYKQNVSQFSYFGKLEYDYDQIFGFDATIRRDASSRFNSTNKWGTFWAVGGFWNITRTLFEDSDVVNNLKIRGSYGTTGNDRVTGGYYGGLTEPFDLFNTGGGYNGSVGLFPSRIGNPNLKWETSKKANVGIDFTLFNNRLSGSAEVYKNVTEDLFVPRPNTAISGGFTQINDNIGSLENKGVELQLSYRLVDSKDFNWTISANGSMNNNEITDLPGTEPNANGEVILNAGQRAPEAVGHAFNTFYAVRWAGVNPANGRPLYLDRNGDLTEQYSLDHRVFTGKSSVPKYQGGFGTQLNYKAFSLDAFFSYAAEVYRYNNTFGVVEDPGLISIANVSTTLLDAWKEPGDITSVPSLDTGSTRNLLTDRYLEDASYLRLKNIVLGYELTTDVFKNSPFESIKIYAQAENLLTWTKWRGFDPEFDPYAVSDFFSYPNARIFTLGIDIKL